MAIDFGTSNSAAARASDGSVQVVPLSHYGNLMPSAVLSDDYGFSVGVAALHQAEAQPGGFFPEPKRAITAPSLHLAGSDYKVPEVIGAVLSEIIARASRLADGDKPSNLVLTHPEAWGQVELERLIESAEAAGIERSRVSLVSEPRAATYWYSSARPLKQGEMAAVFDLGGGTLDVAVLTPGGQGALQVIAARGDNSLGGRTIDARIRDWVLAHLEENDRETLEAFRAGGVSASIALDRSIRQAKEILSDVPRATITVAARGCESIVQLTRGEFEELIAPDVDRAMNLARATLLDAGIRRGSDVPVYLTGGSSRIPIIQERLSELCRVATLDDPKTVVCRGALMGPVRRAEDVLSGTVAWVPAEDDGGTEVPAETTYREIRHTAPRESAVKGAESRHSELQEESWLPEVGTEGPRGGISETEPYAHFSSGSGTQPAKESGHAAFMTEAALNARGKESSRGQDPFGVDAHGRANSRGERTNNVDRRSRGAGKVSRWIRERFPRRKVIDGMIIGISFPLVMFIVGMGNWNEFGFVLGDHFIPWSPLIAFSLSAVAVFEVVRYRSLEMYGLALVGGFAAVFFVGRIVFHLWYVIDGGARPWLFLVDISPALATFVLMGGIVIVRARVLRARGYLQWIVLALWPLVAFILPGLEPIVGGYYWEWGTLVSIWFSDPVSPLVVALVVGSYVSVVVASWRRLGVPAGGKSAGAAGRGLATRPR